MSLSRFLNHRVSIVRRMVVLDGMDQPVLDDYGQPTWMQEAIAADVPAGIQPKRAMQMAAISQAGVTDADHTIYLFPQDITTADAVVHTAASCPVANDLPDATYQVTTVPDAAGAGHHLEVSAKLVGSMQAAYAVGVGS